MAETFEVGDRVEMRNDDVNRGVSTTITQWIGVPGTVINVRDAMTGKAHIDVRFDGSSKVETGFYASRFDKIADAVPLPILPLVGSFVQTPSGIVLRVGHHDLPDRVGGVVISGDARGQTRSYHIKDCRVVGYTPFHIGNIVVTTQDNLASGRSVRFKIRGFSAPTVADGKVRAIGNVLEGDTAVNPEFFIALDTLAMAPAQPVFDVGDLLKLVNDDFLGVSASDDHYAVVIADDNGLEKIEVRWLTCDEKVSQYTSAFERVDWDDIKFKAVDEDEEDKFIAVLVDGRHYGPFDSSEDAWDYLTHDGDDDRGHIRKLLHPEHNDD